MISESDIDKAVAYLRDNAQIDAQKRAERLYLEQYLKTVLAQEQAKSQAKSIAAAEVEARKSQAFRNVLEAYKTAIEVDEAARFLRHAAETKIDVWRTQQASQRKGVI